MFLHRRLEGGSRERHRGGSSKPRPPKPDSVSTLISAFCGGVCVANGSLPVTALTFDPPSASPAHQRSFILYYSYCGALALSGYRC